MESPRDFFASSQVGGRFSTVCTAPEGEGGGDTVAGRFDPRFGIRDWGARPRPWGREGMVRLEGGGASIMKLWRQAFFKMRGGAAGTPPGASLNGVSWYLFS